MQWFEKLARWIERRGGKREIYRMVGGEPVLYLERYYLFKSKIGELMIHRFHMGDIGPVHDHPWPSFSLILKNGYKEHVRNDTGTVHVFERKPGYFGTRTAKAFHKVELRKGEAGQVWTLFGTGKRSRIWGFLSPDGWREAGEYMVAEGLASNVKDNAKYSNGFFPRLVK